MNDVFLYILIMGVFGQLNVDKDQVKAAIKAQQDQQIDNVSIWILTVGDC